MPPALLRLAGDQGTTSVSRALRSHRFSYSAYVGQVIGRAVITYSIARPGKYIDACVRCSGRPAKPYRVDCIMLRRNSLSTLDSFLCQTDEELIQRSAVSRQILNKTEPIVMRASAP